jgi:hypothetical protein
MLLEECQSASKVIQWCRREEKEQSRAEQSLIEWVDRDRVRSGLCLPLCRHLPWPAHLDGDSGKHLWTAEKREGESKGKKGVDNQLGE